ncbi:N-6 DNA methylase [Allosaccharopolyspora coralli]|uniref:site-specific DNA-methyltransferase (adenine-specific) n=1 Tax=Allosaccharopolyspora coralli TaxID=2665642 RepID=A0A5Q3QHJ7_9PSEU|nr:N-6 DNA methylase [Allosaccharopolyspora coralli]QGK70307.1 N-6 DNA methylase [Allosaccharopolyspora coralli]
MTIAQAVATAWNTSNHSGRRDVPLSVVAGLALIHPRDHTQPCPGEQIQAQTPEEFRRTLTDIYTLTGRARPDLVPALYPLMEWLFHDDENPTLQRAAKTTADAALHAGQIALTGTEARYEADLLGMVLGSLKSSNASKANAQIYTPTAIADVMARMNTPHEGARVQDPAVGSGSHFRAAAQAMRENDHDPTTVAWYGADIDNLAIAACAANSLLWELGPHVLLCVADTLAEGDWPTRAEAQHREVVELADNIRQTSAMLAAVRTAQRLTDTVRHDQPECSPADHDQAQG